MSATSALRPGPGEYAPFYAGYVERVGDGEPLALLDAQPRELWALLGSLPDVRGGFRYAPGKWSIRELVVHLADAERIFAYRALRIARGDQTPLPSFDENLYAAASGADARFLPEILDEFEAVRNGTHELFLGLPPEAFARTGTASGQRVSVRALFYIVLGHAAHHLAILRERYLIHPDFPR